MPSELAEIRSRAAAGERLSYDERRALMADEAHRLYEKILDAMKRDRADPERQHPVAYSQGTSDAVRTAIGMMLSEVMALSMVHTMQRERLEDKVRILETRMKAVLHLIPKPRERVKAKSRPSA